MMMIEHLHSATDLYVNTQHRVALYRRFPDKLY